MEAPSAGEVLQNNSILLMLRFSRLGNRRKVQSGIVQVDADPDAISVGKELLESEELKAIATHDGQVREYVYARSLPSAVLKEAVYRLPLKLVDEVDAKLVEFRDQRDELVHAFLAVYQDQREAARSRLRSLYNPQDYPEPEQVSKAFDMRWRYLTIDVPQSLSAAMVAQQRLLAQQDVATEVQEIRLALRTAFADLVSHAAERLESPDNKPRVFRDTLVTNLEAFLAYFQARNLTQDHELAALVEKARAVIHGVTPEELRTQADLRAQVQKTMAQIKAQMDQAVMLRPTRRIMLAPEKAGAAA